MPRLLGCGLALALPPLARLLPDAVQPYLFVPLLIAAQVAGGLGLLALAWEAWRGPPGELPPLYAIDVVLVLALVSGGLRFYTLYCASTNPGDGLLGLDAPTYLANVIALSHDDWNAYNVDKRPLHAWLGAWLGGAEGGDYAGAALQISRVSLALLPALAFLFARPIVGRGLALLVAVLTLVQPLLWPHAIMTTNYPLYYAVVGVFLALAAWCVADPHLVSGAALGVAAGAALVTSEKAPLVLAPVGLAVLFGAARRGPGALGGALLAATAATAIVYWALDAPVPYTPFGNLVANQREELHREMPYAWPEVKQPDPARPSPWSASLPPSLRQTDVEVFLHAISTPPDSDVLRLSRGQWFPVRDTSIGPLAFRLAYNWGQLRAHLDPLTTLWVGVCLAGLVGWLLPTAGVPWWGVLLVLSVLPSCFPPMSFKFHPRYLVHAMPALCVVQIGGVYKLLRALAGHRGALVGAALFSLAWSSVVWTGRADAWRDPPAALTLTPIQTSPPDLNAGGFSTAARHAAEFLDDAPAKVILDCAPVRVGLFRARDSRYTALDPAACAAAAQQGAEAGTYLLLSDLREYRDPRTPDPRVALQSGRWERLRTVPCDLEPTRVDQAVQIFAAR